MRKKIQFKMQIVRLTVENHENLFLNVIPDCVFLIYYVVIRNTVIMLNFQLRY